jgi:septum formation protein
MIPDSYRIILASASPRRRDLLNTITTDFERIVSNVDETIPEGITPYKAVAMLSSKKAEDVADGVLKAKIKGTGTIIIGADTVVAAENRILGKPRDQEEAVSMLRMLQNNTHQVYTGVSIIIKTPIDDFRKTFTECTNVTVAQLTPEEINEYVATGEPMDKAGAYAIQGLFAKYITGIQGDYSNVVGLPVARLYRELKLLLSKII